MLAQYDYRCQACGDLGDTWGNVLQLDHPSPLRDHGDNDQELVPLCNQCHSHKSYLEALTPFQENPLASVFERSVYEAFHESPKPRQAVQQLHAPPRTGAVEIDVIRRRRSALDKNDEPLPICCPLDQIKECNLTLGDYCYVDTNTAILDPVRYARLLPYSGPRWYWKGSVRYMLDHGIVRWPDIKLTMTASAHIPPDFIRHIFDTIEQTQANVRTRDMDSIDQSHFPRNASTACWASGQNLNSIPTAWRQSRTTKICGIRGP